MRSEQEICRHRSKKSLFGSVSFRYKFMHYLLFSVALWITGSGTMAFAGEPLNSAPVANLHNLVAASSTSSASEEVEDAATLDDLADSDELYGDDEYVKAAEQSVADPLYWFNYAMFSFNDKLYFWLLKPVARGYRFITPTRSEQVSATFFTIAFSRCGLPTIFSRAKVVRPLQRSKALLLIQSGVDWDLQHLPSLYSELRRTEKILGKLSDTTL